MIALILLSFHVARRLRATVVETLGNFGERAISFIPQIAEMLVLDDNWLRTVALTQLTKIAQLRPLEERKFLSLCSSLKGSF